LVGHQEETLIYHDMKNSMVLQDTDENIEKMKSLKEGDSIYTAGYEYDPQEGGKILVEEFKFRRYGEVVKNHTEVDLKDDKVIPAVLYVEKSPKVEIPMDISMSFYLRPRDAVQSFRDGIYQVLEDCDAWLISNGEV